MDSGFLGIVPGQVGWAVQDLNLRPLPCQGSSGVLARASTPCMTSTFYVQDVTQANVAIQALDAPLTHGPPTLGPRTLADAWIARRRCAEPFAARGATA